MAVEPKAWLARAGSDGRYEQLALDNELVAIGGGELGDLTALNREAVAKRIRSEYPDAGKGKVSNWTGQLSAFLHGFQTGDLVVLPLKTRPMIAIGRIAVCRTNTRFWCLSWVGSARLRGDVIFAGDAAENRSSVDACRVQADDGGGLRLRSVVGDALVDALVRSGGVVVRGVFGQRGAQVRLVSDRQVIEQLAAQRADHALADRVRARCLRRTSDDPQAAGLEDGVERRGELAAAVADQKLHSLELLAHRHRHRELAGTLQRPGAVGVSGDPRDVQLSGAVLDGYRHVQTPQQHGVHVQEVGRDDGARLCGQELLPARATAAWGRVDAGAGQDLPDSGVRDTVAELEQLTLNPAMPPPRILARHPQNQFPDRCRSRRSSGRSAGRGVLARSEPTMPGQQRRRLDREHVRPPGPWHQLGQRREPRPVRRLVAHPAHLTAKHRVLVPQRENLCDQRTVTTCHDTQNAKRPATEPIHPPDQHRQSQPADEPSDNRPSHSRIMFSCGTGLRPPLRAGRSAEGCSSRNATMFPTATRSSRTTSAGRAKRISRRTTGDCVSLAAKFAATSSRLAATRIEICNVIVARSRRTSPPQEVGKRNPAACPYQG